MEDKSIGGSHATPNPFIDRLGAVSSPAPKLVIQQKCVHEIKQKGTVILLKVEEPKAPRGSVPALKWQNHTPILSITPRARREESSHTELLHVKESKPCCSSYQA